MRLIDADCILSRIIPCSEKDKNWGMTGETAKRLFYKAINISPTIDPLDALGICQCKDCIYSKKFRENDTFAYCYFWEYEEGMSPNIVELDGFCSNSEKRKE